jgi:hypothetical protein
MFNRLYHAAAGAGAKLSGPSRDVFSQEQVAELSKCAMSIIFKTVSLAVGDYNSV